MARFRKVLLAVMLIEAFSICSAQLVQTADPPAYSDPLVISS